MEEKNNQLPADVQARIDADAEKKYPLAASHTLTDGPRAGYIAGATAEHAQNESVRLQLEAQDANVEILLNQKKELIDRSQVLVDALELIRDKLSGINDTITNDIVSIADKYLHQWKEQKEVGDEH